MIFLCPFLHCKVLRTAMYKRYINSIIIIKKKFHYYNDADATCGDQPNWHTYLIRPAYLAWLGAQSTHWRATCRYDTDGAEYTDYMRRSLEDCNIPCRKNLVRASNLSICSIRTDRQTVYNHSCHENILSPTNEMRFTDRKTHFTDRIPLLSICSIRTDRQTVCVLRRHYIARVTSRPDGLHNRSFALVRSLMISFGNAASRSPGAIPLFFFVRIFQWNQTTMR